MAYKNLTAVNIVNVVNDQTTKQYNVSFPAVTKSNFSDMADQLRYAAPEVVNGWIHNLLNLVGLQICMNRRSYESPYRKLFQGDTPTENIQEYMMDVIRSKAYTPEADPDDFFEDEIPDVGTQYVTSPIKKVFAVSINEDALIAAFVSQDNFMNFVNDTVAAQLYNSMNLEETLTVEELLSRNIKEGNVFLIPSSKVVDQATALAFTAQMKSLTGNMAVRPTNKYALAGFYTMTPKEDGLIITDVSTKAVTETYSLAWAFHESFLNLQEKGQGIEMADDSICGGDVFAIYADRYALELRMKSGFPKTAYEFFGNKLTSKRWLHYQAIMALSYFNNMAAFADSTKIDTSASATLGLRDGSTAMNKGAKGQVYVSALTVTSGKLFDKFGSYEVSGNTDDDTMIDETSGKIVIGKNETGSDVTGLTGKYVTVTWTSHLDSTVTATLNIKINS